MNTRLRYVKDRAVVNMIQWVEIYLFILGRNLFIHLFYLFKKKQMTQPVASPPGGGQVDKGIGGSERGPPGKPTPLESKFFHFHAVFGKKFVK